MSRFLILLRLSITLSVCWKLVAAKTSCSEENDEWRCASGECIPKAYMCNGTKQCEDGSDETKKLCNDMQCSDASFRCSYGACISLKLVCDGVQDCVDNSDEDDGSCLKRRNDLPDDDIDDETRRKNCADWGQMKCWSGQCINITGKCNGVMDCADGSDERRLLCSISLCARNQFQCGYGACIPKQAKCNGTQECWDGTDEHKDLCGTEIDPLSSTTANLNFTIVTESIENPSINAINANKSSTEQKNITKASTNAHDFKASENAKTTTTQTTTNHVQIENKELKNTTNIEKPLDTSNEMISTPKTATRPPTATTTAENLGKDFNEIAATSLMKTNTRDNEIKEYSEDNLQTTTPKIKVTTKLSTPIPNGTLNSVIPSYPSSDQTRNFETNLNSSIDNSFVSNSSDQIPPITRPTTEVVPSLVEHPGTLTTVTELEKDTSKIETPARPPVVGTITLDTTILPPTTISRKPQQTNTKQYNTTKITTTLPPTTITTKRQQTVFNRNTTYSTSTTKSIKKCVFRSCDQPLICEISLPRSSDTEVINDYQGRVSLIEGSQVIFNCVEGYDLIGAKRLTCTSTGWSHNSPSCKPYCDADFIHSCTSHLKCAFQQPNSRSKIFVTKEFTQSRVRENSQISFTCDKGYLLEGPIMRKCTAMGWSNEMPRCVNYCSIKDLGALRSPLQCKVFDSNIGNIHDYQYSYWNIKFKERSYFECSCEVGYKLSGENRSTCMNDGWSSAAPTCKKTICDASILADCTYPLNCALFDKRLGNYRRIYRGDMPHLSNNKYLYMSCENGYTLHGSQYLHCIGEQWDYDMPKCIAQTCSDNLLTICEHPLICTAYHDSLRSEQQITNTRKTYPQGTVVVFDCADGYTLIGSKQINCELYGWKYEHETFSSKCQKISKTCEQELLDNCIYPMICERFDTEFNDFRKISPTTNLKPFSAAEHIKISCENGYMLDGRNYLTCTADKWDHTMPKCIAAHSCSGHLIPNCQYPLTCTLFNSKSKSEQIITDKNIIMSTNYALNTQIIFECASGYKLKGEEQTICRSNGWSHEHSMKLPHCTSLCDPDIFLSCKEPLKCFYASANQKTALRVRSDYLITEVPENSLVNFICNAGFRLEGHSYIRCKSKGWEQPVPKCVQ